MARQAKIILLKLEDGVACFAAAVQPAADSPLPGKQAGPSSSNDESWVARGSQADVGGVRLKLCCASEAAAKASVSAAVAAAAAEDADTSVHQSCVLCEAAVAAEALAFVAVAVSMAPGSQQLRAEAAEALSIATQTARALAQCQEQQALADASAAQQALAAGDVLAAATSAVRAKETAAVAMWAACVGGLRTVADLSGALDAAMREADAAVRLAEAAVAAAATSCGAPCQGQPAAAGSGEEEAAAVAAGHQPDRQRLRERGRGSGAPAAQEGGRPGSEGSQAPQAEAAEGPAGRDGDPGGDGGGSAGGERGPPLPGCEEPPRTCAPRTDPHRAAAEAANAAAAKGPAASAAGSALGVSAVENPEGGCTDEGAASIAATSAEAPHTAAQSAAAAAAHDGPIATASTGTTSTAAATEAVEAAAGHSTEAKPATAVEGTVEAGPSAAVEVANDTATVMAPEPPADTGTTAAAAPAPATPGGGMGSESFSSPSPGAGNRDGGRKAAAAAGGAESGPSAQNLSPPPPPQLQALGDHIAADDATRPLCQREVAAVCPVPDPPSPLAPVDAQRAALLRLAATVHTATADGWLPAGSLRDATAAVSVLAEGLQDLFAPATTTAAAATAATPIWPDKATRTSLFTFLSYSVRQVRGLLASGAALSDTALWVDALKGIAGFLNDFNRLLIRRLDSSVAAQAVLAEVWRLLVRTDVLQCLSGVLSELTAAALNDLSAGDQAGTAAEAAAAEAEAAEAAVEAAEAAAEVAEAAAEAEAGTAVEAAEAPMDAPHTRGVSGASVWEQLIWTVLSLLNGLILSPFLAPGKAVPEELQDAARSLLSAHASGRTLEHFTCALLLKWRAAARCRSEPAPRGLRDCIEDFLELLGGLMNARDSCSRSLAVWIDVLLSGPCVQHVLLLHVVSQLCAADGGSSYGLPEGALLPAMRAVLAEGVKGAAARPEGSAPVLWVDLMARAFRWWVHNRARPCSDRALRVLCERAAAAAGACRAPAAGDDISGGSSAKHLKREAGDAVIMALSALNCAAALTRNGAAGDFCGLWGPVVRTANAIDHTSAEQQMHAFCAMRLLVFLPLPPLSAQLTADGGSALAAEPGPDLAAALVAGYVPCLERSLRSQMRLASTGRNDSFMAEVLRCVAMLPKAEAKGLASLIAYGDLTSGAALLATFAKVFGVALGAAVDDGFPENQLLGEVDAVASDLLVSLAAVTQHVGEWATSGPGSQPAHWWRVHGRSGTSVTRREEDPGTSGGLRLGGSDSAEANGSGSGRAGRSGSGRAGGSFSGGAGGSGSTRVGEVNGGVHSGIAPLFPAQQLLLLASLVATQFLPRMRKLLDLQTFTRRGLRKSSLVSSLMPACIIAAEWVPPLVLAYLDCRAAAVLEPEQVARRGGTASRAGCSAEPAAAATAAAGAAAEAAAAAAAEAASWEALLLRDLGLQGLLEQMACCIAMLVEKSDQGGDRCMLHVFVRAVLHVLVAFPRQSAAVLRAPATPSVTLRRWLFDVMADRLVTAGAEPLSFQEVHLIKMLAQSDEHTNPEDVARLRNSSSCSAEARLAALLPPPCFVAAALRGLRLCANPTCANLEGDSEAGWPGREEEGGGGAGTAPYYCSGACEEAHQRAAHGAGARERGKRRG